MGAGRSAPVSTPENRVVDALDLDRVLQQGVQAFEPGLFVWPPARLVRVGSGK